MSWTDEKKEQAIEAYKAEEPTPENSMEIVKAIAEDLEESVNGVRMILTKAGVYVKKTPAAGATATGETKTSTRVSKADAQSKLTAAIVAAGRTADAEIIDKLTGKAAMYLADVISAINSKKD